VRQVPHCEGCPQILGAIVQKFSLPRVLCIPHVTLSALDCDFLFIVLASQISVFMCFAGILVYYSTIVRLIICGSIFLSRALPGAAFGWGTALQAGRSRVWYHWEFWHSPSGRTLALGSTQPPPNRNKYQEHFLGGKDGRCVGLTTLPTSYADCLEIWESQPPGNHRACIRSEQEFPYLLKFLWNALQFPKEESSQLSPDCPFW